MPGKKRSRLPLKVAGALRDAMKVVVTQLFWLLSNVQCLSGIGFALRIPLASERCGRFQRGPHPDKARPLLHARSWVRGRVIPIFRDQENNDQGVTEGSRATMRRRRRGLTSPEHGERPRTTFEVFNLSGCVSYKPLQGPATMNATRCLRPAGLILYLSQYRRT